MPALRDARFSPEKGFNAAADEEGEANARTPTVRPTTGDLGRRSPPHAITLAGLSHNPTSFMCDAVRERQGRD
jgi:hypothetical protein